MADFTYLLSNGRHGHNSKLQITRLQLIQNLQHRKHPSSMEHFILLLLDRVLCIVSAFIRVLISMKNFQNIEAPNFSRPKLSAHF